VSGAALRQLVERERGHTRGSGASVICTSRMLHVHAEDREREAEIGAALRQLVERERGHTRGSGPSQHGRKLTALVSGRSLAQPTFKAAEMLEIAERDGEAAMRRTSHAPLVTEVRAGVIKLTGVFRYRLWTHTSLPRSQNPKARLVLHRTAVRVYPWTRNPRRLLTPWSGERVTGVGL
jgi:hypothetical protein